MKVDDEGEDLNLLFDAFSICSEFLQDPTTQKRERVTAKTKMADGPEPPPTPPERVRPGYQVSRIPTGFRVTGGGDSAPPISKLSVTVAYDRRHRNPFKRWVPEDFVIGQGPVHVSEASRGVLVEEKAGNVLEVDVFDRNFQLDVVGFDPRRDVIVDVRVKEADTDDQTH